MVPPEVDNATAARAAVEDDVPCVACGYNLRGLAPFGRCPECGGSIHPSVIRHRKRGQPLPPPDSRWARQVAEGAVLSVIAFAGVVTLCLAPEQWFHIPYRYAPVAQTPGRATLLAIGASAWVLAWYSAWKLTRRAPAGEPVQLRRRVRWARWPLTLYLACPFLAPAFGEPINGPAAVSIMVLFLCGIVGQVSLMACVMGLFSRIGRSWASAEAAFLSVFNTGAAIFAFLIPAGHGGISSLDLILDLPVYPYGMPELLREAVRRTVEDQADPVLIGFGALALWNALLMGRLAACYLPLCRINLAEHAGAAPSSGWDENEVT